MLKLPLDETNPRIIQDQVLAFAYSQYQELLLNDCVGKDRFQTAARISRIFNVDPIFLIYADTYGVETALEWYRNFEIAIRRVEREQFMAMLENDEEEKKEEEF